MSTEKTEETATQIEDEDDEPLPIPCCICGKPTTRDTAYGNLCYRCCRADND